MHFRAADTRTAIYDSAFCDMLTLSALLHTASVVRSVVSVRPFVSTLLLDQLTFRFFCMSVGHDHSIDGR